MPLIKSIFFDLDDTLFKEHDYVESGFQAVAKFLAACTIHTKERIFCEILRVWRNQGRGLIFDTVCEKMSISTDVQQLVQIYREHRPIIYLYEDAKALLETLKQVDLQIGIITDGNWQVQQRKVEALGLLEYVDHVIYTDRIGKDCWKPSPVPYRIASEMSQSEYCEMIYIGDNPNKDFVMANQLGIHTIRIIRPVGDFMTLVMSSEYEAKTKVQSLEECMNIIELFMMGSGTER